ncbi:MAG TPA: tetratricopeptide repeat protein [Fimbriiglobus sp.]|jgi:putative thioredoxin
MVKSPHVFDVSDQEFESAVVTQSSRVPVVVDFWAPWCPPCRALSPLLAKVVDEFGGRVVVAKVNTDENPAITSQFPVDGIPAVFAIKDGAVVDQFVGLVPEEELREFISRLVPGEADLLVGQAEAVEGSDPAGAEELYRKAFATDARHEGARVGLARALLRQDGNERKVIELLKPVEVGPQAEEADRLRTIIEFRAVPHGDAELAVIEGLAENQPDNAPVQLKYGHVLAARGDYRAALEAMLLAAKADKNFARGPAKESMVSLFEVVGVRSELADSFRAKLQSLLY